MMGFCDVFFESKLSARDDASIGLQVGFLMQAIAPEPDVPEALSNVRSSNLCFGVPMNWALNDADRQRQVCQSLRHKLEDFEPRLVSIRQIDVHEDEIGNLVEFTVRANARIRSAQEEIELETRLSLFDQQVEGANR